MLKHIIFLIILSLIASQALERLELTDWQFKIPSKYNEVLYPAKIPSNVHIDLL